MKRKQKGITLIALVITIIVLLILAGVSIATLTGQNGILTQANNAKSQTLEAQIEEDIKLAYNSVQTDGLINGWDIKKKAEELQKELQKEDSSATVTVDVTDLKVSYKGYETAISSDGTISSLTQSSITINFTITGEEASITADGTKIKEVKDGNVPIPVGFYYVGGSKNTGIVISDSSEDENKGDSFEVASTLKGNQFVWVPVKVNQKLNISVTSKEEITSLVVTDPYGDDILTESNVGTTYSNTQIEPTINGTYRVTITTTSGEVKKSFLSVHSLYAQDSVGDWHATEEYAQAKGYTNLQEMLDARYGEGATIEDCLRNAYFDKDYAETEDNNAGVK